MRLHRLEIQAFGSFPGREVIDFDELCEAGLFLVHGDTGSGKTTILDAVSFALYGDVPGVRDKTGLRSHHAPLDVRSEVELEATLGSRRVRIRRTPQQTRPAKRGSGMVDDKPTVVLSELVDGEWTNEITRLDEAGMRVTDLLGMGAAQFRQVAMLPQGGFAEFLTSPAKDRKKLLEQLFDTGRFDRVADWLGERARELSREVERATVDLRAGEREVQRLVAATGLQDGAGEDEPGRNHETDGATETDESDETGDAGEADEPVPEVELRDLPAWAEAHLAQARERAERCGAVLEQAQSALRAATEEEEASRDLVRRQEEHRQATEERSRLIELSEEHRSRVGVLDAARRAAPLQPLISGSTQRQGDAAEACTALQEDWAHLSAVLAGRERDLQTSQALDDLDALAAPEGEEADERWAAAALDVLARAITETDGSIQRADSLEDLRQRIERHVSEKAEAERRSVQLTEWIRQLTERAEAIPEERRLAQEAVDAALEAAARLDGLAASADRAEVVLQAAVERERLTTEVEAATRALDSERAAHLTAREEAADLRERRLDQMAAELAQKLEPGEPCQVCGSTSHPEPAAAGADGLVTPEEVEAAQQHADRVGARASEAERTLGELRAELLSAEKLSGGAALDGARRALTDAREALAEARQVAAGEDAQRRALDELTEEQARLLNDISSAREESAALATRIEDIDARTAEEEAELSSGLCGHPDVASLRSELLTRREALTRCAKAITRSVTALEELRAAQMLLDEALADAGFAGVDDACAAILGTPALEELQRRVDEHDRALHAVDEKLADPALVEAAASSRPDLDATRARRDEAELEVTRALQADTRASDAVATLDEVTQRIRSGVDDLAPLLERCTTVRHLAELTAATTPDNQLKMKLGTFVLAAILEEVTDAANAHLARMSSDRYAFVYSDAVTDGRREAGLGLMVHDAWAETDRDASTLSGGETFFASLALALGLAEVVTNSSGGIRIDTLFIDEGFGSLDEDTLGDVMETLDSLRDGGRTIGVVSHVGAMRDRIQAHVHVTKTPTGSRVTTDVGQHT